MMSAAAPADGSSPQQGRPNKPHAPSSASFAPILQLISDATTATQYERHVIELKRCMKGFKDAFTVAVALHGVPEVVQFCLNLLKTPSGDPSGGVFVTPLTEVLEICGLPLIVLNLHDQKRHADAQRSLVQCVCSCFDCPVPAIRLQGMVVLQQILAHIRTKYHDDINGHPPGRTTQQIRSNLHLSIDDMAVKATLKAWEVALGGEAEAAAAASAPEGEGEGEEHDASRGEGQDGQSVKRQQHLSEITACCRIVFEMSHHAPLAELLAKEAFGVQLIRTLEECAPSDRRVPMCIETLWSVLTLFPETAEIVGSFYAVSVLKKTLEGVLTLGYKLIDRELRNDIIVTLTLFAKAKSNCRYFLETDLAPMLFDLGCGAEVNSPHPLINATWHHSTSGEDLQLKKFTWALLFTLCEDDKCRALLLEMGFMRVLLAYVNVHCDQPSVVRWGTLQLLELQLNSLMLLSFLAAMSTDEFILCDGPNAILDYIKECPDLSIRGTAVKVLVQAAETHAASTLAEMGIIGLALNLLRETTDLSSRHDCLSILSNVVARDPDLQATFLQGGGADAVVPLLSLERNINTEEVDNVIFAAVNCIWHCIFGSDENEHVLLGMEGVHALLHVLEHCPRWMLSLPLSCIADLLINPVAQQDFRSWQSTTTGKSAMQLLIALWNQVGELPPPEAATNALGLMLLGQPLTVDLPVDASQPVPVGTVPKDVEQIYDAHGEHLKIFAVMNTVGFDDHSELDLVEKATIAIVRNFVELCEDTMWFAVERCLKVNDINPISSDVQKLGVVRTSAEQRAATLMAVRSDLLKQHERSVEESERTFYRSLIKKTEEKAVQQRHQVMSITEAKVRKAQMLKASFKQAIGKQPKQGGEGASDRASEELGTSTDHVEGEVNSGSPTVTRWGAGQRAMTDHEFAVLECINKVRVDPASFIPLLEAKLQYFNDETNAFEVPGSDPEISVEGIAAYEEAIAFLGTVRPLSSLLDVPIGMLFAARDHCTDLGRKMEVAADGTDGSTPHMRLNRYGKVSTKYAQLTSLGHVTPDNIVLQMVVDDGVVSRSDRKNLFDVDNRFCAVATGSHSIHQHLAIIVLAQDYTDKPSEEQAETHEKFKQNLK